MSCCNSIKSLLDIQDLNISIDENCVKKEPIKEKGLSPKISFTDFLDSPTITKFWLDTILRQRHLTEPFFL